MPVVTAVKHCGYFSRYIFVVFLIIKGSLDEKLPSYEVLKMLRE